MFDQSSIIEVRPPVWDGSALLLEWVSSAPEGTVFQVYLDRALAWHGTSRWVSLPMPETRGRLDIGAVGPHEATTDFSANLPAAANLRARLSWLGGSYLDPSGNDDVAGFQIHGETTPGGGIDYSRPLAKIPAYPAGILNDGFGLGGFGQGGFGRAASAYSWTSPALRSGVWAFAVVSFDAAGNLGAPAISSVPIAAPPRPSRTARDCLPSTTRRPAPSPSRGSPALLEPPARTKPDVMCCSVTTRVDPLPIPRELHVVKFKRFH